MFENALGGAGVKDILVIDLHEIIAGKLVALLDRRAARDLFDARRIFALENIDWARVKAAMLALGASGRNDWWKASADNIGAEPNELKQKLLICLPRTAFTEAGSVDAWIEESVTLCRAGVAPLLMLTKNEQAFLDGVLDHGAIDATFLDVAPDVQTADRGHADAAMEMQPREEEHQGRRLTQRRFPNRKTHATASMHSSRNAPRS